MIIAEIIAWVATFFRVVGMLVSGEFRVKALVSIGNLFWMLNGIMTSNTPLIVSNLFCLLAILYDIIKPMLPWSTRKAKGQPLTKGG